MFRKVPKQRLGSASGRERRGAVVAAGIGTIAILCVPATPLPAQKRQQPLPAMKACSGDNGGITLSPGFCATVFADNLGHARHMVVAPNGVVYVNTWGARYYGNNESPPDGLLVALQDTKGDGHANVIRRFGPGIESGNAGGTGIALYKGALYAETNDRIVRYALPPGAITPRGDPEVIVSGLPLTGDHPMHPFIIDAKGHMYMDVGSATNSCQAQNRFPNSPGRQPCTELETRAGIWLYDANRTGQRFSPAERFVTGLRNGEGLAFDAGGRIYSTQHGRDQLRENWLSFYTPIEGANEPAEELVQLQRGADYGWPECYFDYTQHKLVLAPEYGGDGGKTVGVCAQKQAPIAWFPAHWAPNDLALYLGNQFPAPYRGGAFIAFHGSWNRAPFPQGGYNVVFQPLADGKPSGNFVVFADGFAGPGKESGQAMHRPSGLAIGPDGALYISDDQHGRIWRVVSRGGSSVTGVQPAPEPYGEASPAASAGIGPPEGINPNAGAEAALPIAPGATAAQVALGDRVFHGQAGGSTCVGCHGANGKGTPVGSDLTSSNWLWGDGSLASIQRIIIQGIPKPKEYRSPMPPMGGAQLLPSEVSAVAAYVWALSHQKHN